MSTSPELAPHSYVLRGHDSGRARPARLGENLSRTLFAPSGVADPRLVDPHLEGVVEQAGMEARARGFRAGYAAGFEKGRQEGLGLLAARRAELAVQEEADRAERNERLAALTAAAASAMTAALERQLPLLDQLSDVIATASVEIAEALVGHHVQVGGCGARDAVARALRETPQQADVVLRLNPADVADIRALGAELGDRNVVRIVADAAVEPGGAIAVADKLEVDAQLGAALQRVRRALTP